MGVVLSLAAAAVAALAPAQHAVPNAARPAAARPHAAVAATSTAMPASIERTRRPRALLRELRACGKVMYDAAGYRCLRDERARPLVSNGLYCTVTIYAFSAVKIRANMSYGGQTLFAPTRKIPGRTIFHYAVYYELPIVLPAGRYTCKFTVLRKSVKATISGGGAAGPVANSSVCSSTRAVGNLCTADESTVPIAPTTSLTCSGFFVGQKGHFGGIELLYNQNGVWTSLSKVEGTLSRPIIGAPLVVPSLLGQPYAPGQYACRFTLDGQTVTEKLFSVLA